MLLGLGAYTTRAEDEQAFTLLRDRLASPEGQELAASRPDMVRLGQKFTGLSARILGPIGAGFGLNWTDFLTAAETRLMTTEISHAPAFARFTENAEAAYARARAALGNTPAVNRIRDLLADLKRQMYDLNDHLRAAMQRARDAGRLPDESMQGWFVDNIPALTFGVAAVVLAFCGFPVLAIIFAIIALIAVISAALVNVGQYITGITNAIAATGGTALALGVVAVGVLWAWNKYGRRT